MPWTISVLISTKKSRIDKYLQPKYVRFFFTKLPFHKSWDSGIIDSLSGNMASLKSNISSAIGVPLNSNFTFESHEGHTEEEKFHPGNTCFLLVCTALVWLMIPGVGYFYSGMARSKSALSLIMLSFCSVAVVSIQVKTLSCRLIHSNSNIKTNKN